ncbi:hypothetical protein EVAR_87095_1 [Eumeta japonica]|uniref:Uncharacterized protein n=1 Tax=Eumeta variegata TaxID=151549 RepID=A0A4C1VR18_EUMVA|nr:hypothetical protein EVAR_87095_1 [Eumeta japonica]
MGQRERPSGGYETRLLWKSDNIELPHYYDIALKRLHSIERKLDRQPMLENSYEKQIEETTSNTTRRPCYFLHFADVHLAKPGIVRVMFDAAANSRGTSLNDHLLPEPDLLQSQPGVLTRFHRHKIAVAADVQEIFLRIRIKSDDRDVLCYLWHRD